MSDLLRHAIPGATIHVIRNDDCTTMQLHSLLPFFHAVVIGPGPGSPDDPAAVGIIPEVWSLRDDLILPIFGVCLGHQSLCIHFGGTLERLSIVKHGQCSHLIDVDETDHYTLFTHSNGTRNVTRYHSLHVVIPEICNDLKVLAYAIDHDGRNCTRVVMAARHSSKPFWGLQYHPESICTSDGGGTHAVVNFWRHAEAWNRMHGRLNLPILPTNWRAQFLRPSSYCPAPLPYTRPWIGSRPLEYLSTECTPLPALRWNTIRCTGEQPIPVPLIGEALQGMKALSGADTLILDSSASPGRFSIIGVSSVSMERLTHIVGQGTVEICKGAGPTRSVVLDDISVWRFLALYMNARKPLYRPNHETSPFWGGLIGYASYEAGVDTLRIPVPSRKRSSHRKPPDIQFAFVERSIVIDHERHEIHVQSIAIEDTKESEMQWIKKMCSLLELITDPAFTPVSSPHPRTPSPCPDRRQHLTKHEAPLLEVTFPDKEIYLHRIVQAQDYLAAGDSYELCLTALTKVVVTLPASSSYLSQATTSGGSSAVAWPFFKTLRALNPAPYGVFLHLGGVTLVGSSPERFISWTREGRCQMRPIKGTVRKAKPGCSGGEVTREEAEGLLLGSIKELAENLMIVDLVRHDMSRVVSASASSTGEKWIQVGNEVQVTKLFQVEEYETVFQLVSVIEGRVDTEEGYNGWDVLTESLPPGV